MRPAQPVIRVIEISSNEDDAEQEIISISSDSEEMELDEPEEPEHHC